MRSDFLRKSFVWSILILYTLTLYFYGIEIYGNTNANHLSKLMVLNNKLLRILQHKPLISPTSELFRVYRTLPLNLLHNFQLLIFMHNFVHHRYKLPSIFSTYVDDNETIHHYNTRHKMIFIVIPYILN